MCKRCNVDRINHFDDKILIHTRIGLVSQKSNDTITFCVQYQSWFTTFISNYSIKFKISNLNQEVHIKLLNKSIKNHTQEIYIKLLNKSEILLLYSDYLKLDQVQHKFFSYATYDNSVRNIMWCKTSIYIYIYICKHIFALYRTWEFSRWKLGNGCSQKMNILSTNIIR